MLLYNCKKKEVNEMKKIAENTWSVGSCTLKKVVSASGSSVTWYCIDSEGGMCGFSTRKAALSACATRNADYEG